MTARWLLSEIAEELGEEPYWHTQETFNLIEEKLKVDKKVIIIDEVDYLIEQNAIETLRDMHDRTRCPMVLVGMGMVDKKIARYPHLNDRIYKTLKFEHFNNKDISEILEQLTDLKFTECGINYLSTRTNQFRQLVKLINRIEKFAQTNQINELDEYTLKGMLNERQNITTLQTTKKLLIG